MYNYGRFGASYDINWTGKYPLNNPSTSPNSNIYRLGWTRMNAGVTYKIYRETTLFLSVNNLSEEGPEQYTFQPGRVRSDWVVPRSVKFGVTGQF